MPDVSIILDIPVDVAIARTGKGASKDEQYYESVLTPTVVNRRRKYLSLAEENNPPWVRHLIPLGKATPETVAHAIYGAFRSHYEYKQLSLKEGKKHER